MRNFLAGCPSSFTSPIEPARKGPSSFAYSRSASHLVRFGTSAQSSQICSLVAVVFLVTSITSTFVVLPTIAPDTPTATSTPPMISPVLTILFLIEVSCRVAIVCFLSACMRSLRVVPWEGKGFEFFRKLAGCRRWSGGEDRTILVAGRSRGRRSSCGFHPACPGGAAPAGGADPELRHTDVQDEGHRQRHGQERPEPPVGRVRHGNEKRGEEDQARRSDGEPYSERPDHPFPMQRYPSCSDMDEAFDQGDEEHRAEEADDHPLGPAALWDHQPHEQSRRPDHHSDGDK